MPRQSITLTEKNDEWLKSQVEETRDYANKSELVNDLIRRARRAEAINQKLESAENSGFVDQTPEDMLKEFKADLKR
ncbi:MAG TPA: CopG family transcriptional regulator [Alteromonas sp.]|nr:CopG family transcriptional regulator [Alteromonas sp.]HAU93007.1 CopG family transcriptional regulator [Alteromonas sp.]HCB17690.1 CopG family transcriptional regulator [Alteromonas sp.]|tara:strand:- start:15265 stop:15495 length:231 start_codon:yes stop_codon:yes gene_type:complete